MNHRSLAFRLAVWYALLLSATFAVVSAVMFYGVDQYVRANLGDSLRRRSTQIEQILRRQAAPVSDSAIANAIETQVAPEFNNRFARVTRTPDTLIYRSGPPLNRSFNPTAIPSPGSAWPAANQVRSITTAAGRVMVSATPIDTPSGFYLVELGASLESIEVVRDRLLSLLGLLLPVLVACAAGGGYLLVRWALRPVERISQTAEAISVQDLDASLPVAPTGDALQRLSISLNHMLVRLRDSVRTSRRFLADASHELRTPLTVIKGELQQIVNGDHCPRELRERVASVLEEVDRLEQLVSGLLVLSRLDAGDAKREWVEVDVGELAGSTVEQMRLVAEDRGVQLDATGLQSLVVQGDRGRLKQVIVNLLDNAIKFTPRGGVVRLRVAPRDDGGFLEVRDTGIGIPATALPHLFDRFYRVDEARSRDDGREEGGAGLGLSIVHAICSAHGAEITVESTLDRGSCFRVRFPQSAAHATFGVGPAGRREPPRRDPWTDTLSVSSAPDTAPPASAPSLP